MGSKEHDLFGDVSTRTLFLSKESGENSARSLSMLGKAVAVVVNSVGSLEMALLVHLQ